MQVVAVGNLGRGFVRDAGQEQYHCVQYGDVKGALARKDAGGWYVLDGRALTALPAGARAVAKSLGLASTLTCPAWLDKSGTWLVYLGL